MHALSLPLWTGCLKWVSERLSFILKSLRGSSTHSFTLSPPDWGNGATTSWGVLHKHLLEAEGISFGSVQTTGDCAKKEGVEIKGRRPPPCFHFIHVTFTVGSFVLETQVELQVFLDFTQARSDLMGWYELWCRTRTGFIYSYPLCALYSLYFSVGFHHCCPLFCLINHSMSRVCVCVCKYSCIDAFTQEKFVKLF